MLQHLTIRNFAIIQHVHLEFHPQLNIITGETGAGKSILVGALSLVLGDRADTSVLLDKNEKCIVEACFMNESAVAALTTLREFDIESADELMLRREIYSSGKSRAFVNDTPVTLQQLRQVALLVVDLHRQFDALQLGSEQFINTVVNAVAGSTELFLSYQQLFAQYRKAKAELEALSEKQQQAARELDYNQFLYDELAEAGFQPDEIERLEDELLTLSNADALQTQLEEADHLLHADEKGLLPTLRSLQLKLQNLRGAPASLLAQAERIQSLFIELKDIAAELRGVAMGIENGGARLQWVEDRMSTAQRLLKKHQVKHTAELLELQEVLKEKLEHQNRMDENLAQLSESVKQLLADLKKLGQELGKKQEAQFETLAEKVQTLLLKMEMPNARIKLESKPLNEPGNFGLNQISLLFDANKTGRFEGIEKVASGGELSRLMLSIKSLVASSTALPVLIFDEIDSGISGEASKQVGLIMKQLAAHHQIISITHQPQIAALAHHHLFVYKEERDGKVKTQIRELEKNERIKAIARMLGGNELSEASLRIASEMVNA